MKNFIQRGEIVPVTAPAAVASGAPVLIGSNLFGVAQSAAELGGDLELVTRGVFDLPKTTSADAAEDWAVGDPVYFVAGTGRLSKVAAGNTLVGVALAAAGKDATTGRVFLHGQAG